MTHFAWYAWCFDHGHLHRFEPGQPPWCTARWVPFDAYGDETALIMKRESYGDAQFLHQLPDERQLAVIDQCRRRNDPRETL